MASPLLIDPQRTEILEFLHDPDPDPERYRSTWRRGAARILITQATLRDIGRVFGRREIPWLVIKGADITTRQNPPVFARPEERPFGDLDVVIHTDDLDEVRQALRSEGWIALQEGELAERYLQEEGYAWQAQREGQMIEVHHRLWGSLPREATARLFAEAQDSPELGPTALRPSLPWAWVLAAFHIWLSPHRDTISVRDLALIAIAGGGDFVSEVVRLGCELGAALPLIAAAAVALDPHVVPPHTVTSENYQTLHRDIISGLHEDLRWVERRLHPEVSRPQRSHARMTLARMLAGRKTRHGWRLVGRSIWPHPGTVAVETPDQWSWPRRRAASVWRRIR
ncbi:MAG: nucleotidyltransferase family protein [Thermoanaerobaculia bacterium]|nr:nucleotidyltransferase family protein [Thermoanaerobaculia bacterium]